MLVSLVLSAALMVAPASATQLPDLTAHRTEAVMTGLNVPYTGEYYRPSQRAYQLCVLKRESNGHWFSTNRSHGYFGAFQFNKALTSGATWMMTPELKRLHGPKVGKAIAAKLRQTEMHRWKPYYQAMAFFTVLNWNGDWSGKKHWRGGRWTC